LNGAWTPEKVRETVQKLQDLVNETNDREAYENQRGLLGRTKKVLQKVWSGESDGLIDAWKDATAEVRGTDEQEKARKERIKKENKQEFWDNLSAGAPPTDPIRGALWALDRTGKAAKRDPDWQALKLRNRLRNHNAIMANPDLESFFGSKEQKEIQNQARTEARRLKNEKKVRAVEAGMADAAYRAKNGDKKAEKQLDSVMKSMLSGADKNDSLSSSIDGALKSLFPGPQKQEKSKPSSGDSVTQAVDEALEATSTSLSEEDARRLDENKRKPKEIWRTESGKYGVKDEDGNVTYFDDRDDAEDSLYNIPEWVMSLGNQDAATSKKAALRLVRVLREEGFHRAPTGNNKVASLSKRVANHWIEDLQTWHPDDPNRPIVYIAA
jgi:hypothetical protein